MNPANIFVPLSWFFGTIFVTVLAVKSLNLLWSKRDQLRWPRSKRNTHGGPSMSASVVVDTPSQIELERDQLNDALQSRTSERDTLLKQLSECKHSLGVARLLQFSDRARASIEKSRSDGHDSQDVHVTIRFTPPYDEDYALAKEIAAILRKYPGWPVKIDGGNDPLIEPSDTCRAIFDASFKTPSFEEVAAAFQEGELIKGPVGFRSAERDDHEHLIVEVPPRVVKQ